MVLGPMRLPLLWVVFVLKRKAEIFTSYYNARVAANIEHKGLLTRTQEHRLTLCSDMVELLTSASEERFPMKVSWARGFYILIFATVSSILEDDT